MRRISLKKVNVVCFISALIGCVLTSTNVCAEHIVSPTNEASTSSKGIFSSHVINQGDTVVFDFSNPTITPGFVEFPVSIISDDQIFALDFSFNFNTVDFQYVSVTNIVGLSQVLANYNVSDQKLRLTSNDFGVYPNQTNLVSLKFSRNVAEACAINLNTIAAYLNGEPCSYKIIGCSNPPSEAGLDQTICATSTTLNGNAPSFGQGTWTVVSGSGTFTDLNNPLTSVFGLAPGNNVFSWTFPASGSSPALSDQVTITRNELPSTANAGSDITTCTSLGQLAATAPLIGTGAWTIVQGNVVFEDATDPSTNISAVGQGSNIAQWTVSNGVCPTSADQITILRTDSVYAGPNQIICANTTNLAATVSSEGEGYWTLVSGTATIVDSLSPTSEVTGLQDGENIFQWTIAGIACPDSSDLVSIIVKCNVPPVIINDAITLLEDAVVNGNVLSNGDYDPDSTELIVTTTPISGPSHGQFQIASNGAFTYTPDANFNGVDTVIVSICDQGIPLPAICVNDTLVFTISAVNDTADVINEHFLLLIDTSKSDSLLVNDSDVDGTTLSVTSLVSGPSNGTFVFDQSGAFTYTPDAGFVGFDTVIVSVCDNGFPLPAICVNDTLFFEIIASPFYVFAGDDSQICENNYLLIGSEIPSGATGIWSQSSGTGIFQAPTNDTTLVNGLSVGVNTFIWTVTIDGLSVSDTVQITVFENPGSANAGLDLEICGNAGQLQGINPSIGQGSWQIIEGTATIETPTDGQSLISDVSNGTNSFVWTISNGVCSSSDTVIVVALTLPSVSITSDTSICEGQTSLTLPLQVNGTNTWSWTTIEGNATVDQQNPLQPLFSNFAVGNNVLVVAASNGSCLANDTLSIFVYESASEFCNSDTLFIPDGFSPNGDGVHDQFVIENLNGRKASVEIYNRWGNLVFAESDYQNNWNGTSNQGLVLFGEILPEGTYYYIIQIEGEDESYNDYLTLWR
ncbi:MAG: hypothetical protein RLZZ543_146 [Bacteroidota bacterium]|jgi:gliding motility-associated-like protein